MRIDAANATEILQCQTCGHSLTTGKTIGKPNTVEVKCPKCQATASLQVWRSDFEPLDFVPDSTELPPAMPALVPTPRVEGPKPTPKQHVGGKIANGFIQIALFIIASVLGLAAIVATIFTVAPMFLSLPIIEFKDEFAPGLTANVIQRVEHELAAIRYLLMTVILWFLTMSVVKFSKNMTAE
jgi:Zn ribbon nucleic-acid-binding protein